MADYNKLKATELKDLLKERGIPSTGLTRKQQYIEALEAEDANSGKSGADGDAEGEVAGDADGEAEAADDIVVADATAIGQNGAAQVNGADEASTVQQSEPAVAETEGAVPEQPEQPDAEMPSAPQQGEPQPSTREPSSESRKRKRRSPSPPVSQDAVNKRLKAAEEENGVEVKLPEDQAMNDASTAGEQETALVEDDRDVNMENADQQQPLGAEESGDIESHGSLHQPTRAIYVRDLVRPVQPSQLKSHLEKIAAPADSEHEEVAVFHLDALRTHAFAVFNSVSAAARARSSLHDHIWPEEPSRKPLWVDFVPDDEVNAWIETESANGNRRDAKRWEVVYSGADGSATASHQEAINRPELQRAPSSAQNSTLPLASPGAREEIRSSQQTNQRPQVPSSPAPARKLSTQEAPRNESFNQLDSRFKFTETKPKLYYLPRDRDLVDRRLDELESKTSRSWDGGRNRGGGPDSQLRRYTFDDGDVLVDGGPDFGNFGVPPRRGRGGGRGPRGRR